MSSCLNCRRREECDLSWKDDTHMVDCTGHEEYCTNFESITESPEKLAEFLDKIIRHCSDYDKDCTECPMKENRNCDYETTLEWLMKESDTE